jgi:hypothetical protein
LPHSSLLQVALQQLYASGGGLDCGALPAGSDPRVVALVTQMVTVAAEGRPQGCGAVAAELQASSHDLQQAKRAAALRGSPGARPATQAAGRARKPAGGDEATAKQPEIVSRPATPVSSADACQEPAAEALK